MYKNVPKVKFRPMDISYKNRHKMQNILSLKLSTYCKFNINLSNVKSVKQYNNWDNQDVLKD